MKMKKIAVLIFRRIFQGYGWIFGPRNDRADEMEMIWALSFRL